MLTKFDIFYFSVYTIKARFLLRKLKEVFVKRKGKLTLLAIVSICGLVFTATSSLAARNWNNYR